jgi:osmoprotectant transport system substrate-binding protein
MTLRTGFRTILVVDIEGYGDPVRDDRIRRQLRDSLFESLGNTLAEARVAPEYRSDLGDGWMGLLGGDAAAPVLHAVTDTLHRTLLELNHDTDPAAKLRVRAVVHAGYVSFDERNHPYGRTVIRAFRMLDADSLKVCLRKTSGALMVGVSNHVYEEVVRLGLTHLQQSQFEPVGVRVKEERGTLWVYAPEDPGVAERSGLLVSGQGGVPPVLVAHAAGDEAPAAELGDRLKQAGYEIAHRGPLLTGVIGEKGETLADEAVPALVADGPVVVCGTVGAVGSGWASRLDQVSVRYPEVPFYPVRMESGADLELVGERLDWATGVAEWWQDQDRTVGELSAALANRYPARPPPDTEDQEPEDPGGPAGKVVRVVTLVALVAVAALGWVLWGAERAEEDHPLASWYDLSDVSVGIGSKDFTGQHVLGHIAIQVLRAAGADVRDQTGLGSTGQVREALVTGGIDGYFEYTGTGWIDILGNDGPVAGARAQFDAVAAADDANGITWFALAPANDTYALAASETATGTDDVQTISDYVEIVRQNPAEATLCTSDEFRNRDDGLSGLAEHYGFEIGDIQVVTLNPDAIYARVAAGETCQFGVVFSLAGEMNSDRLTVLDDDRSFFPSYNVAMVMRTEVYEAHADNYDKLFGEVAERLTDEKMRELNARIVVDGQKPADVAREFLRSEGII